MCVVPCKYAVCVWRKAVCLEEGCVCGGRLCV